MESLNTINFKTWIDEHRHLLKPPVANRCIYTEAKDFIIMIVGGPNARKDYHYNEGEEFFYQIEGDMVLKIIDDDQPVEIPIRAGEIFLLPPKVPHSPQRPANTVGLVIERMRHPGEHDGCIWFCESCNSKVYEEYFHIEKASDIVAKLKMVMEKVRNSEALRTCKKCGVIVSND